VLGLDPGTRDEALLTHTVPLCRGGAPALAGGAYPGAARDGDGDGVDRGDDCVGDGDRLMPGFVSTGPAAIRFWIG
jgi:hypothetical protein